MNILKNKNQKKFHLKTIASICAVFFVLLFVVGCGNSAKAPQRVTLEYWGVWNEASDMASVIGAFQQKYPYVTINYKKLRFDEYQDELITAWAQDRGPDIFAIPNAWITAYQNFIAPMPVQTTMVNQYIKRSLGGTKEQLIVEKVNFPGYTPEAISRKYVDVVKDDIILNGSIYALPLSMDTLAMYYNKDMLAQASIPQPPTLWSEFVEIVPRITLQDTKGNIVRSAVSLGTADNMERPTDILMALMLQNGVEVNSTTIGLVQPSKEDPAYLPGPEALKFYTDFALPTKKVYTWNNDMPNSLEAFAQGKTAFFFGFAYHKPLIESQAQGIDFDIARLPQISPDQNINFANYWVETVAQKSAHANEAWNFLQFATGEEGVIPFLDVSKKPTALRSLITSQAAENITIEPFIIQGLTAKSWYHGSKPVEAESILQNAINKILSGNFSTAELADPYKSILEEAARKIQTTL